MEEDIKHIIISGEDVEFGDGGVPGMWSHEVSTEVAMEPDAFLLYIPYDDFVEMRQIYVALRNHRQGLGTKILKHCEEKTKELGKKKIAIRVGFTPGDDDDHPFRKFLIKRRYKKEIDFPPQYGLVPEVWLKKL